MPKKKSSWFGLGVRPATLLHPSARRASLATPRACRRIQAVALVLTLGRLSWAACARDSNEQKAEEPAPWTPDEAMVRSKFNHYDVNNSGNLDENEVMALAQVPSPGRVVSAYVIFAVAYRLSER